MLNMVKVGEDGYRIEAPRGLAFEKASAGDRSLFPNSYGLRYEMIE